MKFVICNLSEAKAHGIEIIPTMRQSVDGTQVVLHEEYIRNIDEFSKLTRYEYDSPEFTQLMNSEAWTHGEDYVQPNEDYAKVKAMQILTADTKANINTMSLSNKEAIDVKEFYPVWSADSVQGYHTPAHSGNNTALCIAQRCADKTIQHKKIGNLLYIQQVFGR